MKERHRQRWGWGAIMTRLSLALILAWLVVAAPPTLARADSTPPQSTDAAQAASTAKVKPPKPGHQKEIKRGPVEPPNIPTQPQQPITGPKIGPTVPAAPGATVVPGTPFAAPDAAAAPAAAPDAAAAPAAAPDAAAAPAAVPDAAAAPAAALAAIPSYTIDMKVLVIAADGKETDFPALTAFLSQIGIPFDTLIAVQQPLTAAMLSDGVSHGYYQGIILTTGNLGYDAGGGNWQSAFDATEWSTLWQYEAMFGVRQMTSYTLPGGWPDTYGLNYVGYQDTTVTPLQATLTAAGKSMYPYLNTASPITIKNAWTYLGTVISSAATTPLLVTSNGYAISSITTYADGRQNLTITAANNPYLIHSLLLSYGNINWVTKGVFLGERHVYLNPQNDDILIDDDIWDTKTLTDTTGITYRMTGSDLKALVTWQNKSVSPTTPTGIITEWAFVGEGASGIYANDTLTPAVKANQGKFRWVNHTYTHLNLDDPPATVADTLAELQQNDAVASQLGLTNYRKEAFINPDISGLTNPDAQQGLAQFGIKYEISDTSRPGWNNPSPNAGFISSSGVLIIPRRPTNLFYNLDTTARWVSEYNCFYGPTGTCAGGAFRYWPTNLTYQQILDKESDMMLQYLLKWDIDPLMFHQPNTRNLGTASNPKSLQGDLINATLTKYKTMYSLPILNISESTIGEQMLRRMAYNNSGVTATLNKSAAGACTMTISTANQAAIPVTGPVTGAPGGTTTESYGGQTISFVPVSGGSPVSLTLPASSCN